jgi:hypothetical protein
VSRLVSLGRPVPSIKIGSSVRIPAEALRKWIEAQTRKPGEPHSEECEALAALQEYQSNQKAKFYSDRCRHERSSENALSSGNGDHIHIFCIR